MSFLQDLADLVLEPKSQSEIDALTAAAAPAPAAADASDADDDAAVQESSDDDDDGRPALGDATYALTTRCTLEATQPFPWKHATARDHCAGVASFTKREDGGDAAAAYRAASLRWEYDRAALRASVERGDGEWCMALYGAYEGWRARDAASVYAQIGGVTVLWTRHAGEETVLMSTTERKALDVYVKAVEGAAGKVRIIRGLRDVVVARGPTACRAALNAVLNLDVAEPPPRRGAVATDARRQYAILSDGAFQYAALKPLVLVFNRPVRVPGAEDKHRFVVEGWLLPTCAGRLLRAAEAAHAISFVELDEATACFDRADVAQRLAELCAPAVPPSEDIVAAASDSDDALGDSRPAKRPVPSP
jgi:hypothetical protein